MYNFHPEDPFSKTVMLTKAIWHINKVHMVKSRDIRCDTPPSNSLSLSISWCEILTSSFIGVNVLPQYYVKYYQRHVVTLKIQKRHSWTVIGPQVLARSYGLQLLESKLWDSPLRKYSSDLIYMSFLWYYKK